MSRPESVSSKIDSLGDNIDICKISFFFFSPPENPTLSCLFSFSSSNFNSFAVSFTSFKNSMASSSFSPLAFLIAFREVFKKMLVFTPGISSGYWKAFQYPLEIPGVNTNIFLKTSLNAIRKARGEKELDAIEFLKLVKETAKELKFDEEKLNRQLNVGFSGGEKKKNEILQMSMLSPKLSILDETDSGLDIDALKVVSDGVNTLRRKDNSFLIITHYQRLLDYIKPDFVHVLMNGKIIKSGGPELALELEKKGYENFN